MSVAPGTRLGPYEVVSLLGVGGMGEVYQARDERLNRMVAVKLLPAELVADAERRKRFIQEAQLASSLQHPHIITIFDIGSSEHGEYLAMELVRGQTLDQLIPQRGMRLPEALRYGIQITDALSAAHGAGIVHRDLKPGNIMVTEQGQIKILDFGLATLTEHQSVSPVDETRMQSDALRTGAGTILGTVAYMSPEQAEGKKVDARSDLFSFGSILYEMLSGKRAFKAESTPGTLAAVINLEPAPLAKLVEDIPQAVERLVSRCLRKDLSRRAQHASDIKVALEELQEDSESLSVSSGARATLRTPRSGAARSTWSNAIIAALVLVVVLGGGYMWWESRSAPPPPAAFAPTPLTTLAGSEQAPTFSPDGTQISFTWTREGTTVNDVYAQIIGGGSPLRLTDDGGTHVGPTWSPDGKSIAVWHLAPGRLPGAVGDLKLVLVSPLGGPEREVLSWTGAATRIAWSPDSRWLAVSPTGVRSDRDKGITLISASTNERIEWAAIDKNYAGSVEPAFSLDGQRIAFAYRRDDFSSDLLLASVGPDGRPVGPPTPLPAAGQNARFPLWTADGRELIFLDGASSSNGGVVRVPVDGSRPFQRIPGLEHATTVGLSGDRTKLAFGRGNLDADIWRIDLRTGTSGRIAASTLHDEAADVSPDGQRIAFSSNRQGAREIWVSDLSGDNALPLTHFGGPIAGTAQWSPDGRTIAFDARPAGNSEIFIVPAAGGSMTQLTRHPGEDARPAWSHDGKWIYFASDRGGRSNIWRMAPDGSNPVQIATTDALWIAPSRTNDDIYYTETVFAAGIRRLRADGTDEFVVRESVRFIATSKSGLWFGLNPKPGERSTPIRMLRFSDGSIREVARVDFVGAPVGMSVAADEQSILLTRPDVSGTDLWLVENFR